MDISVSIIDYMGVVGDGVAVLLSLKINDELFEMIYWFNPKQEFTISIDKNFYKKYPHIKDIYDYEYLIDLLYHIDNEVLPNKDEIFNEFQPSVLNPPRF